MFHYFELKTEVFNFQTAIFSRENFPAIYSKVKKHVFYDFSKSDIIISAVFIENEGFLVT